MAAQHSAERRWVQAVEARYWKAGDFYPLMMDAITPAVKEQITAMEFSRPGSGLAYVIDHIEPEVAARDRGVGRLVGRELHQSSSQSIFSKSEVTKGRPEEDV